MPIYKNNIRTNEFTFRLQRNVVYKRNIIDIFRIFINVMKMNILNIEICDYSLYPYDMGMFINNFILPCSFYKERIGFLIGQARLFSSSSSSLYFFIRSMLMGNRIF